MWLGDAYFPPRWLRLDDALTRFSAASASAAAKADLEKKLVLANKASADAQAANPRMDRLACPPSADKDGGGFLLVPR